MEKPHLKREDTTREGMVHFILSHSYMVFFLAIMLGTIFHVFFPIILMPALVSPYVGLFMIMIGSVLIYWAQSTSRCTAENRHTQRSESDFEKGPYKYTRNPTHIGLTIMTLGLAVIFNSFFTALFIIFASITTKLIFLKEEEALLEKKYGDTYCEYKRKVKTWV